MGKIFSTFSSLMSDGAVQNDHALSMISTSNQLIQYISIC